RNIKRYTELVKRFFRFISFPSADRKSRGFPRHVKLYKTWGWDAPAASGRPCRRSLHPFKHPVVLSVHAHLGIGLLGNSVIAFDKEAQAPQSRIRFHPLLQIPV